MKARNRRLILSLAGLYFLGGCLYALSGLGLNLDEGYVGAGALRLLGAVSGRGACEFPLMESYYVGFTLRYLAAPFLWLAGPHVFVLRLFPVCFAFCSLFLVYYVMRRVFDRAAALTTVVLWAVNSTNIRSARHGCQREEFFQIFCVWLGLALIERARERNNRLWVWAAGFVWGLALWAKLMFLGYVVGAGLALAVFYSAGRRHLKRQVFPDRPSVVGFVLGFGLGAAPLAVFNLRNGWVTVVSIWRRLWVGDFAGWDNLRLIRNVQTRAWDFVALLEDQFTWMDSFTSPIRNEWWLVLFFLSLAVLLCCLALPRMKEIYPKTAVGAVIVVYFGVWLSTLFIPQAHTPEHLGLMMPFAEIVCALALCTLVRAAGNRLPALILAAALLVPHAAIEARVLKMALSGAARQKGFGEWSGVVYRLGDWIETRADRPVISPFFLYGQLYFLTEGRKPLIAASALDETPEPERIYAQKLSSLDSFYLLRPLRGTHAVEFARLVRLLGVKGMRLEIIDRMSSGYADDLEVAIVKVQRGRG